MYDWVKSAAILVHGDALFGSVVAYVVVPAFGDICLKAYILTSQKRGLIMFRIPEI